jgi:peptidoglycan-associated lipoprotein
MRSTVSSLLALVSIVSLALGAGCATAETKAAPKTSATASSAPAAPAKQNVASSELPGTVRKAPSTDPLYFQYDGHLLESDAQARLREIATYLATTPGATVRISGHADERGTNEYNLALGDARARAALDYLIKLGVEPARIRFETLGEERPADLGHDEGAWQKNRRDEIVFEG